MLKVLFTVLLVSFVQAHAATIDRPDDLLTRAEAAALFARELFPEEDLGAYVQHVPFEDVASNDWYAGAMGLLAVNGVWSDEPYVLPSSHVLRWEFLEALFTLTNQDTTQFREQKPIAADISMDDERLHILFSHAVALGLLSHQAETLTPYESIRRADALTIVNRYNEFKEHRNQDRTINQIWKELPLAKNGSQAASYRTILMMKGIRSYRDDSQIRGLQEYVFAAGKLAKQDTLQASLLLDNAKKLAPSYYQYFVQETVPSSDPFVTSSFKSLLSTAAQVVRGIFVLP